jgi:hypothetical protein
MHFELWEISTGNAIGDYQTESAALAVVRETARADGRSAVQTFALVRVNTRGRATTIATGNELAERALTTGPRRAPVPA